MNKKALMAATLVLLVLAVAGMQIGMVKANFVAFEYPHNPNTIISVESPANLTRWEKEITLKVSLNLSLWYPSYLWTFWNSTYTCAISSFEYVIDGKYKVSLLSGDTVVITPQDLQLTSQGIDPAPQFIQISKNLSLGFLPDGNHSLQVKTTTNGKYWKGGPAWTESNEPVYDKSDTLSFFIGKPTYTEPTPAPSTSPTPTNPQITIISALCQAGKASFNFTAKEPCSWIGYSLDGRSTVTITGNVTTTRWLGLYSHYICVSDLTAGKHEVTFYTRDESGDLEQSSALSFTINEQAPKLTPTPTTPIEPTLEPTQTTSSIIDDYQTLDLTPILILSGITVIAVAVGALVYFKRGREL